MLVTVCAGCRHVHVGRVCECGCDDWSKLVGVLDSSPPPSPESASRSQARRMAAQQPVTDAEAREFAEPNLGSYTFLEERIRRLLADRARREERIREAEQERDDYKEATADVLVWMRGWLDAALASHADAIPDLKVFWAGVASGRRAAIRQVENIEARNSPRRIRALLGEVPDGE